MDELTKKEKIDVANEVFGWWMCYAQNAGYRQEPVMPFGVWLLHVESKLDKEAK